MQPDPLSRQRRGEMNPTVLLASVLGLALLGIAGFYFASVSNASAKREVDAKVLEVRAKIETEKKRLSEDIAVLRREAASEQAKRDATNRKVQEENRDARNSARQAQSELDQAKQRVRSLERQIKSLEEIERRREREAKRLRSAVTAAGLDKPAPSSEQEAAAAGQADEGDAEVSADAPEGEEKPTSSGVAMRQAIIEEAVLKVGQVLSERGLLTTPDSDTATIAVDGFIIRDLAAMHAGGDASARAEAAELLRRVLQSIQQPTVMANIKLKKQGLPPYDSKITAALETMRNSLVEVK